MRNKDSSHALPLVDAADRGVGRTSRCWGPADPLPPGRPLYHGDTGTVARTGRRLRDALRSVRLEAGPHFGPAGGQRILVRIARLSAFAAAQAGRGCGGRQSPAESRQSAPTGRVRADAAGGGERGVSAHGRRPRAPGRTARERGDQGRDQHLPRCATAGAGVGGTRVATTTGRGGAGAGGGRYATGATS